METIIIIIIIIIIIEVAYSVRFKKLQLTDSLPCRE